MNKWVDEDTLYDICGALVTAGYDYRFAEATKLAALQFEGVYDLLLMWVVEKTPKERRTIIADIAELLLDIGRGYELQASKKEQEAYKKLSIDYEKLLAKYNGVFEWVYNNEDQLPYLDTVDEIKTSYEGSLK